MSSTKANAAARNLLALVAAGSLAACGSVGGRGDGGPVSLLPTTQFPLATTTQTSGIQLAPHSYGLSPAQADALTALVADWKATGEGLILIEAPVCACDDGAMTAYDARDALIAFGAPEGAIRMIGYEAGPQAPIRVSFQRLSAQAYNCGQAWSDLTKSGSNQPRSNFGCAVNANLAAMIENPADINRPRASDPYDAGRRQVVIERYRAGQATVSEPNTGAEAVVSNVVQ